MKEILIKPHHFLDMFKLYGRGVERFVPDRNRGHDFDRIGNIVLENPLITVCLTVGTDDVCRPCRCLENDKCVDLHGAKHILNKMLDKRIFRKLDLKEGDKMTTIELCRLMEQKIPAVPLAVFGGLNGRWKPEKEQNIFYED